MIARLLALAVAAALVAPLPATAAVGWQRVGTGITEGVSGLAVLSVSGHRVEALSVVDNKKPGQDRVRRIVLERGKVKSVRTLTWQGDLPTDLEAVTPVPGHPGEFIVVSSAGQAYRVRVTGDVVTVLASFALPAHDPDDNFEGFALHRVGARFAAVWADRGAGARSSTVYSAFLSLKYNAFNPVTTVEYTTGASAESVRHVSDIAVTASGALVVSGATDPGDDGPFTSSLREIGRLSFGEDTVGVTLSRKPRDLGKFGGHKIEAVTLVNDRVLLGTDDENNGGFVAVR